MITEEMKLKYAKLLIRKGVNVQHDQPLVINASVRDADFVRLCVDEAYRAGAKSVTVNWADEAIRKMSYENESIETLETVPQWLYDKMKYEQEEGACYLRITSEKPGMYNDVDPDKIIACQSAYSAKMKDLRHYLMANEGQWCIAGMPSYEWAEVVFPDIGREEAFAKLEEAIFAVGRVSDDNDPLKDWANHDAELTEHARKLNEYNFKEMYFRNGLGTDLTVGLVNDHVWAGGNGLTPGGVEFDPNIPTEEVFCMPHKDAVNGIVYASKPLSYNGKVIEDFWFRFSEGKVVDFGAGKEADTLRQLLDFDEGSRRLGEVALVPYDSPVSHTGMLFFNTLYDENAACHLALGASYPENLKGGTDMGEEDLLACGANQSMQHEDFMFGTEDMEVDGICFDGRIVPVFRKGNFVI